MSSSAQYLDPQLIQTSAEHVSFVSDHEDAVRKGKLGVGGKVEPPEARSAVGSGELSPRDRL